MSFFCDNQLCPRHEEFEGQPTELDFIEEFAIKHYKAHKHGSIFLCDTCHQAVLLAENSKAASDLAASV